MAQAERIWNGGTATGDSTGFIDAEPMTKVTALVSNGSTKDFIFTVQGWVGGSTSEFTLIAAPTTAASTGASVQTSSTGNFAFTNARINVSTNNTTGLVKVWLAGA